MIIRDGILLKVELKDISSKGLLTIPEGVTTISEDAFNDLIHDIMAYGIWR